MIIWDIDARAICTMNSLILFICLLTFGLAFLRQKSTGA